MYNDVTKILSKSILHMLKYYAHKNLVFIASATSQTRDSINSF